MPAPIICASSWCRAELTPTEQEGGPFCYDCRRWISEIKAKTDPLNQRILALELERDSWKAEATRLRVGWGHASRREAEVNDALRKGLIRLQYIDHVLIAFPDHEHVAWVRMRAAEAKLLEHDNAKPPRTIDLPQDPAHPADGAHSSDARPADGQV